MESLEILTERGIILNGVLFSEKNVIDFIYAQTNDAFAEIETKNLKKNFFSGVFIGREQSNLLFVEKFRCKDRKIFVIKFGEFRLYDEKCK